MYWIHCSNSKRRPYALIERAISKVGAENITLFYLHKNKKFLKYAKDKGLKVTKRLHSVSYLKEITRETFPVWVVSFSGGKTSAYMLYLIYWMAKQQDIELEVIYMDTGMEHPKTYEFIRNIIEQWGIKVTCLKVVINPVLGEANDYEVVDYRTLKWDLTVFKAVLRKYGAPYMPSGAFCTDRMKLVPHEKYCDEKYGKNMYTTWLGMRVDEPDRLIERDEDIRYLAEISDFDKFDIIDWWEEQPFKLEIPEWLGNCIFCIKKGVNKIALAAKAMPEEAEEFKQALIDHIVRDDVGSEYGKLIMYRGKTSLEQIMETYKDVSMEELMSQLRGQKRDGDGGCSESCDIFNPESRKWVD